jgi:hypothetical protein
MGKGRTQEDAIAELLLLPETDQKRTNALNLLVSWRINIELTDQVNREEERVLMALSQAYLEWEKQTVQRGRIQGLEQGLERLEQERRSTIVNLMQFRYGSVDQALQAIVPQLLRLDNAEYTRLLLQLSRAELIQHFDHLN